MVTIDQVSKVYDGQIAVDNLSLEISAGEFVILIGPSGCGKTTTLKMINRLIEPSSGTIRIRDKNILAMNAVTLRREIGYVIQQIGLFPNMTIEQNVDLVPRLLGWSKDKRQSRVYELLSMVNMDPEVYAQRYPTELSGGQQQRIGVLRALAAEPPLILMDEPFGALDPITRENLQDELKNLQSKLNKTIIFVTHDIDEAIKMADRIVLMKDGKIVQAASPEEILRQPADDFVESFIGKKRLNGSTDLQTAQQVMHPRPVTITSHRGTAEGVAMMKRKQVDTLLVVDEAQRIQGVVNIEMLDREHRRAKTIGDLLDENVVSINAEATAQEAFNLMVTEKLKYLPVVDKDSVLVGLITRTSMVNALAAAVWGEESNV